MMIERTQRDIDLDHDYMLERLRRAEYERDERAIQQAEAALRDLQDEMEGR